MGGTDWKLGALMVVLLGGIATGWFLLRGRDAGTGADPVKAPSDPATFELPDPVVEPPPVSKEERLRQRAEEIAAVDPAAALTLYEQLLQLEPARHDLRLRLGLLRWAIGQGDAACAAWEEIPNFTLEYSRARLWIALEGLSRNIGPDQLDADEIVALCRAVPDGQGHLTTVARAVQSAFVGQGALAAIRTLERVPGWEPALVRVIAAWEGPFSVLPVDPARLARDCTTVLESGVPLWWVYGMRGVAARQLGDLPQARADLDRALSLNPAAERLLFARAQLRRAGRDFAGTIEDLSAALAIDPQYAEALVLRGDTWRVMGSPQRALADLTAAMSFDPANVGAFVARARVRSATGDTVGAIADLNRALALDPTRPESLLARAPLRAVLGDGAGAVADYDAALRLDPASSAARIGRGQARALMGDFSGALADLDAALAMAPQSPEALFERAAIKRRLSQWRGAVRDLEAFLNVAPNDPRAAQARVALAEAKTQAGTPR